jgi:hypothetical protein
VGLGTKTGADKFTDLVVVVVVDAVVAVVAGGGKLRS